METQDFAVIAAGVVLFGLVSKRLQSTIITAPMVFAAFGLLIGEAVFGLAHLDFGHGFIHGLAEVTLVLVLFSDAARIDLRQLRRDHNLPVRMLLIGLPLVILLGDAHRTRPAARPEPLGGRVARRDPGADRCRLGSIGGVQPPRSGADSPGPQHRERLERRDRAARGPAVCRPGERRPCGRRGRDLDLVCGQADHLGPIGRPDHWRALSLADRPVRLHRMDGRKLRGARDSRRRLACVFGGRDHRRQRLHRRLRSGPGFRQPRPGSLQVRLRVCGGGRSTS